MRVKSNMLGKFLKVLVVFTMVFSTFAPQMAMATATGVSDELPDIGQEVSHEWEDEDYSTPVAHLEGILDALERRAMDVGQWISDNDPRNPDFWRRVEEFRAINDEILEVNAEMNEIWQRASEILNEVDDATPYHYGDNDPLDDWEDVDDYYRQYQPFAPVFTEVPERMSDEEIHALASVSIFPEGITPLDEGDVCSVDDFTVAELRAMNIFPIDNHTDLRAFLLGGLGPNNGHFVMRNNISVTTVVSGAPLNTDIGLGTVNSDNLLGTIGSQFLTTGRPGVFSGVFDGCGNTVRNLRLRTIPRQQPNATQAQAAAAFEHPGGTPFCTPGETGCAAPGLATPNGGSVGIGFVQQAGHGAVIRNVNFNNELSAERTRIAHITGTGTPMNRGLGIVVGSIVPPLPGQTSVVTIDNVNITSRDAAGNLTGTNAMYYAGTAAMTNNLGAWGGLVGRVQSGAILNIRDVSTERLQMWTSVGDNNIRIRAGGGLVGEVSGNATGGGRVNVTTRERDFNEIDFDIRPQGRGTAVTAANGNAINSGFNLAGGVVGFTFGGHTDIENTIVRSTRNIHDPIRGREQVGGITGGLNNGATLRLYNVENQATVMANHAGGDNVVQGRLGGLVGRVGGTAHIENSRNYGFIQHQGNRAAAGGLVGYGGTSAIIRIINSHNGCRSGVQACPVGQPMPAAIPVLTGSTGAARREAYPRALAPAPGMVVHRNSSGNWDIRGSNLPNPTAAALGGIVGRSRGSLIIEDTVNYGEVRKQLVGTGSVDTNNTRIGGIVGRVHPVGGQVVHLTNVTNYGNVTIGRGVSNGGTDATNLAQATGALGISALPRGSVGGIMGEIMNPPRGLANLMFFNLTNHGTIAGGREQGGIIGWTRPRALILWDATNTGNLLTNMTTGASPQGMAVDSGGIIGRSGGADLWIAFANNSGHITNQHVTTPGAAGTNAAQDANGAINAGGIVGRSTGVRMRVMDAHNTGDVRGRDHAGGVIGFANANDANVTLVSNRGNIYVSRSGGAATAGGIVGRSSRRNLLVRNAANFGAVRARGINNANDGIGGIVGRSHGVNTRIEVAFNHGTISGRNSAGGILGRNQGNTNITDVYNTGQVTGLLNTAGLAVITGTGGGGGATNIRSGNGIVGRRRSGQIRITRAFVTGRLGGYAVATNQAGNGAQNNNGSVTGITFNNVFVDGTTMQQISTVGGGSMNFTAANPQTQVNRNGVFVVDTEILTSGMIPAFNSGPWTRGIAGMTDEEQRSYPYFNWQVPFHWGEDADGGVSYTLAQQVPFFNTIRTYNTVRGERAQRPMMDIIDIDANATIHYNFDGVERDPGTMVFNPYVNHSAAATAANLGLTSHPPVPITNQGVVSGRGSNPTSVGLISSNGVVGFETREILGQITVRGYDPYFSSANQRYYVEHARFEVLSHGVAAGPSGVPLNNLFIGCLVDEDPCPAWAANQDTMRGFGLIRFNVNEDNPRQINNGLAPREGVAPNNPSTEAEVAANMDQYTIIRITALGYAPAYRVIYTGDMDDNSYGNIAVPLTRVQFPIRVWVPQVPEDMLNADAGAGEDENDIVLPPGPPGAVDPEIQLRQTRTGFGILPGHVAGSYLANYPSLSFERNWWNLPEADRAWWDLDPADRNPDEMPHDNREYHYEWADTIEPVPAIPGVNGHFAVENIMWGDTLSATAAMHSINTIEELRFNMLIDRQVTPRFEMIAGNPVMVPEYERILDVDMYVDNIAMETIYFRFVEFMGYGADGEPIFRDLRVGDGRSDDEEAAVNALLPGGTAANPMPDIELIIDNYPHRPAQIRYCPAGINSDFTYIESTSEELYCGLAHRPRPPRATFNGTHSAGGGTGETATWFNDPENAWAMQRWPEDPTTGNAANQNGTGPHQAGHDADVQEGGWNWAHIVVDGIAEDPTVDGATEMTRFSVIDHNEYFEPIEGMPIAQFFEWGYTWVNADTGAEILPSQTGGAAGGTPAGNAQQTNRQNAIAAGTEGDPFLIRTLTIPLRRLREDEIRVVEMDDSEESGYRILEEATFRHNDININPIVRETTIVNPENPEDITVTTNTYYGTFMMRDEGFNEIVAAAEGFYSFEGNLHSDLLPGLACHTPVTNDETGMITCPAGQERDYILIPLQRIPDPEYVTVTFDLEGGVADYFPDEEPGSLDENRFDPITVPFGEGIADPAIVPGPAPYRSGFTFLGWEFRTEVCEEYDNGWWIEEICSYVSELWEFNLYEYVEGEYVFIGENPIPRNMTLFARWQENMLDYVFDWGVPVLDSDDIELEIDEEGHLNVWIPEYGLEMHITVELPNDDWEVVQDGIESWTTIVIIPPENVEIDLSEWTVSIDDETGRIIITAPGTSDHEEDFVISGGVNVEGVTSAGGTPTPPSDEAMPQRPGYVFTGEWKTCIFDYFDGEEACSEPGEVGPIYENTVFRAVWEPIDPPITVFFYPENGEFEDEDELGERELLSGQWIGMSNMPEDPVRPGYVFLGWYDRFGTGMDFTGRTVVEETMTVFPMWDYAPWVTVIFSPGADDAMIPGYDYGEDATDREVRIGLTLAEEYQEMPENPERLGYEFDGWFIDGDADYQFDPELPLPDVEGVWDEENERYDFILNIIARWTANDPVTVTFDPNGSTLQEVCEEVDEEEICTPDPGTRQVQRELNLARTEQTMPGLDGREGWSFIGWFINGDTDYPFDVNTPVNDDMTVVAVWEQIRIVVTYSVVDEYGGELEAIVNDVAIESGDEVAHGSTAIFTATPDFGYEVIEWRVNGEVYPPVATEPAEPVDEVVPVEGLADVVDAVVDAPSLEDWTLIVEEIVVQEALALDIELDDDVLTVANITNATDVTVEFGAIVLEYTFDFGDFPFVEGPVYDLGFDADDYNTYGTVGYEGTPVAPEAPINVGYRFDGWALADAPTVAITVGPITADTDFVAIWTAVTVDYQFVWGDFASADVADDSEIGFNAIPTAPADTDAPDRDAEGFNFSGQWYMYVDGVRQAGLFVPGETRLTAERTVFVAVWNSNEDVTVTFQVVETDADWDEDYGYRVIPGGTAIGADDFPEAPALTGFDFIGWFVVVDGEVTETEFTATTNVATDTVVRAVFARIEIDYAFDFGDFPLVDGEDVGFDYEDYNTDGTIYHGETPVTPAEIPINVGYRFVGWSLDGEEVLELMPALTDRDGYEFIAVWEEMTVYYTFNWNFTDAPANVDGSVGYNGRATAPTDAPTRPGYRFVGWEQDVTARLRVTGTTGTEATPHVFDAVWEDADAFIVTFDVDGGVFAAPDTGSTATRAVRDGLTVGDGFPAQPTKFGQTFLGWFVVDGVTVTNVEFLATTPVTADVTVRAVWSQDTVEVTFGVESGDGDVVARYNDEDFDMDASPITVNYDGTVVFTATPDEGYEFAQWLVNPEDAVEPVQGLTVADWITKMTAVVTEEEVTDFPIITKDDNVLTAENIREDLVILAVFTQLEHNVDFEFDGEGTVTGEVVEPELPIDSDGTYVVHGRDVIFTATPDAGYRIASWHVNDVNRTADANGDVYVSQTLRVNNITADTTVTVVFEPIEFEVTFGVYDSDADEVTAVVAGEAIESGDDVRWGASIVFTATPPTGYYVAGWRVRGELANNATGLTFTYGPLEADLDVEVVFAADGVRYEMSLNANNLRVRTTAVGNDVTDWLLDLADVEVYRITTSAGNETPVRVDATDFVDIEVTDLAGTTAVLDTVSGGQYIVTFTLSDVHTGVEDEVVQIVITLVRERGN